MTVVRQVGIKEEHLEMLPCDTESVLLGNICPLFPKRDPEGHKGTYGRLLMICGSVGMQVRASWLRVRRCAAVWDF